ncbi:MULTISPECIES: glycine zipper family protein [Falsihalocynthiibacter]|uniref:Glycine zipper family protein n=1 Tax=Falsihalocynthiibacter arcticus TaxID=1579316 RepID=A0A126V2Q8_9RHOB|nr:glycine zipper family protein [Falsihalocynthiibacter arcticus]AML52235.1 hypothetical protein RC74_14005 [Falsihalocynthiibacter arcticus]
MLKLTKISVVPLLFLATACTNTGAGYTPIIDGPVSANYNYDLSQCQNLAASQPLVDEGTIGTVATAAAVGGAASAISKGSTYQSGRGVAIGALVGATGSALQNNSNREVLVRNCMRGRGYNVVG